MSETLESEVVEETIEVETETVVEEKAPRVTSKSIIAELESLGYTGPTSYNKPDLLKRLEEVKAGTYTGRGAPGSE